MNEPVKTCPQCDAIIPEGSTSSLCVKCLLQVGFETDPGPTAGSESRAYQPTFIAPTINELAPHFPQLEILVQIGHGGMGVVYKARQTELDRIVALKILRPNVSSDASFAERFQREARTLAKLNHPNIITIYDFGRKDGLFFFIMEFVDGTNLQHVERSGQLSPQEALSIVPQVCSALQYAHDNGVVHRDIKPENILITKSGDVRIADFGLAKLAGVTDDAPLTGTWQVMGTPHYMAPEQFEKPTSVDHRADIYSLGVVIYELLTGELPLGRFLLPSEKVRVDIRLDDVVLRSLAKEPDRRYQRVTDVATAVDRASLPADKSLLGRNANNWMLRLNRFGGVCRTAAGSLVTHILKRKNTVGVGLIICGVAETLSAFLPLMNDRLSLAILSLFCGLMAIFLGLSLKREKLHSYLWLSLFACIVPYTSLFSWGLFFRIPLAIIAVPMLLSAKVGSDKGLGDYSGILDQLPELARGFRSACSLRSFVFTLFGFAAWIAIFMATLVTVDVVWKQDYFPSFTIVNDLTASEVRPLSEAYQLLHVQAFSFRNTRGLNSEHKYLSVDNLDLQIFGPKSRKAHLKIDLSLVKFSTEGHIEKKGPLQRDDIIEWMNWADIDSSLPEVQHEIDNLFDVVHLLQETRGNAISLSRINPQDFPTLKSKVTDLMKNRRQLTNDLIPLNALLDRELFSVQSALTTPYTTPSVWIAPREWPVVLYSVLAGLVFLQGFLRVGRVLYKQLWFPLMTETAHVNVETEAASIGNRWKHCRRILAASASVSALILIIAYIASLYGWNESIAVFSQFHGRLNITREILAGAFLAVAILMAILALLARPVLRTMGLNLGIIGGAVAVVSLPLSLVTFPNGLAAWILLTDPAVRQLFRADVKSDSNDETS